MTLWMNSLACCERDAGHINVEEEVSSWISRRISSDGTRKEIDARIVDDSERWNEITD
jgi:hypothetical protein